MLLRSLVCVHQGIFANEVSATRRSCAFDGSPPRAVGTSSPASHNILMGLCCQSANIMGPCTSFRSGTWASCCSDP